MVKEKRREGLPPNSFSVQFNLSGLVIFSVSLVMAAGILTFLLLHPFSTLSSRSSSGGSNAAGHFAEGTPGESAPWGELLTYDTQMERPEEYSAQELDNLEDPEWTFNATTTDDVRKVMSSSGLTAAQIDRALSPGRFSISGTNTVVKPDSDLIFSLSPDVRGRFYGALASNPANRYFNYPFCFPGNAFDQIAEGGGMDDEMVSLIRPLLYQRGDARYFSDFEAVMQRIPSADQRLRLVKALSSQSAVLARLRIRPTTDIDKVLGYWAWAPGVRFTDLRPLLESLRRMPEGGTISLLYFLPPFARERLYTYPLPSQAGDPTMDCHWSTLNFFNEKPDNRFANPSYTATYLESHYYPVAKPTHYGDLMFLIDPNGQAIHSAVYIADDIVFTKNGNNYMEPWMLMRIKNLLAMYSVRGAPRVLVYRNKDT